MDHKWFWEAQEKPFRYSWMQFWSIKFRIGCFKITNKSADDWEINFNYDFFFSAFHFFLRRWEKMSMVQKCTAKMDKRIGDEQNEYMS